MKYIIPNLSDEQKKRARQILEKESFSIAREILAEPPPSGLGMELSKATLSRLKQRLELEDQLASMADLRPQAGAIATEQPVGDLRAASLVLLKEKAFQLALSNDPTAIELSCRILRSLQRLEPAHPSAPEDNSPLPPEAARYLARILTRHYSELELVYCKQVFDEPEKIELFTNKLLEIDRRERP
jgi:hypothetical protein